MMKLHLLREENLAQEMESRVKPCFQAYGREKYYFREKGRGIFCLSCHNPHPKGVILISHGFCESGEKYRELAYYFFQAGYSTYIPEHCGHGHSYRLTGAYSKVHIDSYERYARDLAYVAYHARKENHGLPLYLFGHSMGGAIAGITLGRCPGMFRKAILNAPMILQRTDPFPPVFAHSVAYLMCKMGKGEKFAVGQHAFQDDECFEESCCMSRARFDYYYKIKQKEPLLQNSGASYSWGLEAYRMSHELLKTSCRRISIPVLLFQAELDTLVYPGPQEKFVRRLPKGRLVRVPAKHEIYRSENLILKKYLGKVIQFYEG